MKPPVMNSIILNKNHECHCSRVDFYGNISAIMLLMNK